MAFQDHLRTLGQLATEAHEAGWITEMPSLLDSVQVAVIGEIKRGKSTFLNALMGEKVFPSRSSVCTTAVTFLKDGPPSIEAVYRSELKRLPESRPLQEGENIFDCLQEVVAKPNLLGKKGNSHAKALDSVVVTYPNRFATDGVRLVDTPGINDPESWREEITFQFLPQVDAALMLLDPQQPLSKSEMDFIQNRATNAVKDQLLLVINRCDEVKPADLEKSVARIRRELEPMLPNARIFTVASKLALEAKKSNEPVPQGWLDFEQSLDQFLHAGKAGALLLSRAKGLYDDVSAVLRSKETHLESLSHTGAEEKSRLDREKQELERIQAGVATLRQRSHGLLAMHREKLFTHLEQFLAAQRSHLRSISNNDLPAFTTRFLRDLQELREAWLTDVATELEGVLQQEVMALVGKEPSIRAFRVPSLDALHAAPTFSAPKKGESSGFLPGLFCGILGSVFGGPLVGAGVAFLARSIFSTQDSGENQAAYAAFRRDCETFLHQCTATARQDVENLLHGMEEGWIPQFFDPLQTEIKRQSQRVSEIQSDLGKGEQERNQKRQVLIAAQQRLESMLKRTNAFLSDLRAAGSEQRSKLPAHV